MAMVMGMVMVLMGTVMVAMDCGGNGGGGNGGGMGEEVTHESEAIAGASKVPPGKVLVRLGTINHEKNPSKGLIREKI